MSITISITIPAPTVLTRRPDLTWRSVRPFVPVLLAGAEQLVPGLGLVVAIAGLVGVQAAVEVPTVEEPADEAAGPDVDDTEEPRLRLVA
ncbi:hypothetical protein GCM10023201_16570 [Actinomycetospora corticicola]|uniref:Uncharacterized protein n=1 Tax=Actinomycetospora corticicola TaxID=663602 RepID=A0A7Y9DUZ1_9PSEU|nr:hypothetical protein [Actinomycetospora corticicola]NYD35986.1 hypothetical protein [Actinomycetospora corticicola]